MLDISTGEVIKRLRKEAGYTQTDFAVELNISRSALSQLEAGKSKPNYDVLKLLFLKFSLSPEEIFGTTSRFETIDKQTLRSVNSVTEFWLTQYEANYSPLAEDKMISKLLSAGRNREGAEALLSLLNTYRKVLRFTDLFEMEFLDPLKRMNAILYRHQVALSSGSVDKELADKYNNLFLKIQKLLEKAILLNQGDVQQLDKLPEDFCSEFSGMNKNLPPSLKMFRYSQEKYLQAFFYLLEAGERLEHVSDYYDNEDFYGL